MRNIITTNDLIYDILNNLLHHDEIIVNKIDINNSLKSIMGRFREELVITDEGPIISIKKAPGFNYKLLYRRDK